MIRSPPWPVNIIVETGLPLPATVDACIHLYSIWNKALCMLIHNKKKSSVIVDYRHKI